MARLFIEQIRRLRQRGIAAGFLQELRRGDVDSLLTTLEPALVVVDYAEARPLELRPLLEGAAERRAGAPLRIALLARNEGDWLEALKGSHAGTKTLLSRHLPHRLRSEALTDAQRRSVFTRALETFAERLGRGQLEPPELDLSDPLFGRALYLLFAALAVVDRRRTAAPQLLEDTVDHEVRVWGAHAPRAARRLVGALTLRGHTPRSELKALDKRVDGPQVDTFRDLVRTLYPGPKVGDGPPLLTGLEPDLLGEGRARPSRGRPRRPRGGHRSLPPARP